jgi:methylenetetrahydrofolate dehydrogenase (NADP+)/methenyltetrahydrofolate cyclohydrolase
MILDGKLVANEIKQRLKEEIDAAVAQGKRRPSLIIYTVGDDPASKVYVRNKIKACEEVGIKVEHFATKPDITTEQLKERIRWDNEAPNRDGIIVQLPLPDGYDERKIIDTIYPSKDVDGLTTINIGKLRSGQPCFHPCTAQGIIDLLDYYNIKIDGKDVTIVGRSNIVGKPLADLMMARGATVTQCHSHTQQLSYHTKMADIVISAVGKPKFICGKDIWDAEAIIDVGINRDENEKLCGDVDYNDVVNMHGEQINITPVPGGVGPMTVAELMKNTIIAWRKNV